MVLAIHLKEYLSICLKLNNEIHTIYNTNTTTNLLLFANDPVSFQGNGNHGIGTTVVSNPIQKYHDNHRHFKNDHDGINNKTDQSGQVKNGSKNHQTIEPDFQVLLFKDVDQSNVTDDPNQVKNKTKTGQNQLRCVEGIVFCWRCIVHFESLIHTYW